MIFGLGHIGGLIAGAGGDGSLVAGLAFTIPVFDMPVVRFLLCAGICTIAAVLIYDAYVGQCEVPAEFGAQTFTVTKEGDRLYVEIPHGARLELLPQSETSFFHMSIDGMYDFEVSFTQDGAGQATEAFVEMGGREFTCKLIRE